MFKPYILYILLIPWLKAGLAGGIYKLVLGTLLIIVLLLSLRDVRWGKLNMIAVLFTTTIPILFLISVLNPSFRAINHEDLKELNFYKRLQSSNDIQAAKFLSERFRSILATNENSKSESLAIFFDSFETYRSKFKSKKNEDIWVLMNDIYDKIKFRNIWFLPSLTIVEKGITQKFLFWFSNFLLACLLIFKKTNSKDIYFSSWFILINCSILALVGIMQKFNFVPSDSQLEILGIWDTPEPRYFFSTFTYKNHWSAFAIISLFYGASLMLHEIRIWGSNILRSNMFIIIFICLSIIIFSVFYCGSRSGVLFLLFSVFIITFLIFKSFFQFNWKHNAYFLVIPTVLLGSLFLIFLQSKNLTAAEMVNVSKIQINDISNGKFPLRWYLWNDSVKVGREKPFFGHGFNSYPSINPLHQSEYVRFTRNIGLTAAHNPYIPLVAHAHNDWLEWWCEWGLLGLVILFLPILAITFSILLGKFSLNSKLYISSVAIIFLYSCVDFPTRTPACLALCCFTFGIALSSARLRT